MKSEEPIRLSRQCEAVQIPSGKKLVLPADSRVWIAQSHGGGTTVTTERGEMVRIAAKDTDALGMPSPAPPQVKPPDAGTGSGGVEGRVWDQLKMCFDPEIPINIVDLGLVYHCQVIPLEGGANRVEIRFTLTAPGCGMGEVLKEEIRNKVLDVAGVQEVQVDLVWNPPWDQSMISGAGKIQLGML
jgi:probable FeS assembly SUF system protein SufT